MVSAKPESVNLMSQARQSSFENVDLTSTNSEPTSLSETRRENEISALIHHADTSD